MSLRRRIAQQLARAAGDANLGGVVAGTANMVANAKDNRRDHPLRDAADDYWRGYPAGAVIGAAGGRALRTAFRRTGNAEAISAVRRSGRGMMPKGQGAKRQLRQRADEAAAYDRRGLATSQARVGEALREKRLTGRMNDNGAHNESLLPMLERYARRSGKVAGHMRQREMRAPLTASERRRAFRQFGNAKPVSSVPPTPKGGRYSRPEEHAERLGENARPRTGAARPVSSVKPRETQFKVSPNPSGATVSAERATSAGTITTPEGHKLRHRPGDMIVTYGPGDRAVVRGDIFRDTYRRVGAGQYAKKANVTMRASVANEPRTVRTLEGPARAERGDVIMRGTRGERWPVKPDKFGKKYRVHF